MDAGEILKWLERQGTKRTVEGMARYGIRAERAFGVTVGTLQSLAKRLGKDHALSLALWETGWYEARLLAAMVGEPQRVTRRQMDAWAAEFENWADCDTVCFHLFDRTPLAWERAPKWSASPREFVRRGGFVLMACLAAHDKAAPDGRFLPFLKLIEKGAGDDRNFVKKGVSWALRGIGRRSRALHA
ncbi:MAG TPA: DNA alkylation repair protein, partial [Thermoanaerobaculia bacterium]|nr:DNA alkylation repair protein [Thermoanaerobaculia bacterium]